MWALTDLQAGVWITEEMGLGGTVYHLPLTVDLDGPLSEPALRAACAATVRRHPALATALRVEGGEPFLVPAPAPELRVVDLTGVADVPALDRATAAEITRAFDRTVGPLARFTLLRRSADRHRLVVVAHHLVFDGASKDLVLAELAAAYGSADRSGAAPAEVPSTAADPVDDLAADEARRYWRTRWRRPEPLLVPGGPPAADAAAADSALRVDLDRVVPALRRTSVRLGATRFELVLTALRCLLLRYGNARATVAVDLGTRTARTRGEVGMFANQLPVDGGLDPEGDFAAAVTATRAALRELRAVGRTPLSRAVAGVPAGSTLAPVSISYRRRAPDPAWPAELRATVDRMPFNSASPAVLHLQVVEGPDGLDAVLQHQAHTVGRDEAELVAGDLRTLLEAALAGPTTALGLLPLPTGTGRDGREERSDGTAGPGPDAVPRPAAGAGPADPGLAAELAAIWAAALRVPAVGPHDDLFELGGHSLTVTRIAARMRQQLHIDLPLHVFFDGPTVAQVLAVIEERAGRGAG